MAVARLSNFNGDFHFRILIKEFPDNFSRFFFNTTSPTMFQHVYLITNCYKIPIKILNFRQLGQKFETKTRG